MVSFEAPGLQISCNVLYSPIDKKAEGGMRELESVHSVEAKAE